jgi:hypothetical protein
MWSPISGDSAPDLRAARSAAHAALAVIAGIVLSGPLALLVVALVHPQPPWASPALFAAEFDRIQLLPYFGGFLLIGGCVALVAHLAALAPPAQRGRANVALALAGAFAALIVFNYILQTTFVPALVTPYRPEHDLLVTALAMSNPRSLAWAIEMWGYGVLGIATWLVACAFDRTDRLERVTRAIFIANGIISIAGALATALAPGWVMTVSGGVAFGAWNLLMVGLGALVIAVMRRRRAQRLSGVRADTDRTHRTVRTSMIPIS